MQTILFVFLCSLALHYVLTCLIAATQILNQSADYIDFRQRLGNPALSRLSIFLRANGLLDPAYYLTKLNEPKFRRNQRRVVCLTFTTLILVGFTMLWMF